MHFVVIRRIVANFNTLASSKAATELNVIRGQPATIKCDYTGSYVQVSWTSDSRTRRRKSPTKTLFLRVNDQNPTSLDDSWVYVPSESKFDAKSTLTITKQSVDFGDEGFFDCKDATKTTTNLYNIKVISLPELTISSELNESAIENEAEKLIATCTAANAKPPSKITWVDDLNRTYQGRQTEVIKTGNVSMTINQLVLADINYDLHAQVFTKLA